MNLFEINIDKHRLTEAEKEANNFAYYKRQTDKLDHSSVTNTQFLFSDNVTDYRRRKVNYDLFNNIINLSDFAHVCQPYGDIGELPAQLANRDIVSGKIKVLLGMEMKMPFSWKAIAVNREATTRKEKVYFGKIKDYVSSEIMRPIKMQMEQQAAAEAKGKPLTEQEKQQLRKQVEENTRQQTPDEVRKYMSREHQDPAEVQCTQILEYLMQNEKIIDKFNKGFKHLLLSAIEVYYVGILNKQPVLKTINSLNFNHDMSSDLDDVSDGEWATCEYRMAPSQVVSAFGDKLTNTQIDKVYEFGMSPTGINDTDFTFDATKYSEGYTIRVLHATWKGLMKIGFLYYYDKEGEEQLKLVDENYKINKAAGDIKIEWEWIPQAYETYKITDDIYVCSGQVAGQIKDIDNLYKCKLPYYGSTCDSLNSIPTSAMDRMKDYQYFFDIILYRVELLLASDKGKILVANINAIPKSAGIDVKKWTYFLEANKIAWMNPSEEGNRKAGAQGSDVTNLVKEIDMSLVSQINNYISLAEYIERKCGSAIGVTPQMEAQISANEAVTNTKQNLIQSSHIIQPYFQLHNTIKSSVLQAMIDTARVAYALYKPEKLSYVLDDMSVAMLDIDMDLLDSTTIGIFVANSTKAEEAKQVVQQLAQAALQNQQAELGDIIKVIRASSIDEAEELLEVASQKRKEVDQMNAEAERQAKADEIAAEQAHEEKLWNHEKDMIILKETERRETEVGKAAVVATGFAEDKDANDNGQPDVLDLAKHVLDGDIKGRKMTLEEEKFNHDKEVDKRSLDQKDKEIAIKRSKPSGSK